MATLAIITSEWQKELEAKRTGDASGAHKMIGNKLTTMCARRKQKVVAWEKFDETYLVKGIPRLLILSTKILM